MIAGIDVGRKKDATVGIRIDGNVVDGIAAVREDRTFREQAKILDKGLRKCSIVTVDCTGLGQGLFEVLEELGHPVVRVVIISGDKVFQRVSTITAGKSWLMQRCRAPLLIDPRIKGSDELKEELRQIRMVRTGRGKIKYEPRTGHDDFVLAYALALLAWDLKNDGYQARHAA